jgi:hypothetical protein
MTEQQADPASPAGETTDGSIEADAQDAERWLVIDGRRWRRTDPCLPEDLVAALKSQLGTGRSTVGAAKRSGDEERVAAARRRVGLAKLGLGERGDYWWDRAESERIEQARTALRDLAALDA